MGKNDVNRSNPKVEFYSGHRAEETPRAVLTGDTRLEIIEILERRRLMDTDSGLTFETFLCRLENGSQVLIRQEETGWAVEFKGAG